ncbi:polysaccharide biosynthesis C-terminal domain-containing protein [Verrucomicrobiales bacterium BCK34]|nr:polysaccharide biosynthesis C-terminal domain-containing protein [Verrucomicrobiales bacterium BCK34]
MTRYFLKLRSSVLSGGLSEGIAWTIGSFFVLAISGVLINLIVAWTRDAASLGIFNLAYAVYIVSSQVAAFGVNYSVLRHAAYYSSDPETRGAMAGTALLLSVLQGGIAFAGVYFLSPLLGELFSSEETGKAIRWASFGLIVFPLNKILVAYINGLRRMRAFAILQASRYLLVMAFVAGVSISNLPFYYSTLAFAAAELATASGALIYLAVAGELRLFRSCFSWIKSHLSFGGKSLLSGMFVEMNSRLDVLLLGVLVDERLVGIYSFGAMLVDGLYHVLAMVRINFNPILVEVVRDKKWELGRSLLSKSRRYAYGVTLILALLVFAVFLVLAYWIVPDRGLQEGIGALVILLVGLTLISAYVPLDNLLLVSGHPAYQTFQNMAVAGGNVLVNLWLVPIIGIEGAALGTVAGYVMGMLFLFFLSRRMIGWDLLANRVRCK